MLHVRKRLINKNVYSCWDCLDRRVFELPVAIHFIVQNFDLVYFGR